MDWTSFQALSPAARYSVPYVHLPQDTSTGNYHLRSLSVSVLATCDSNFIPPVGSCAHGHTQCGANRSGKQVRRGAEHGKLEGPDHAIRFVPDCLHGQFHPLVPLAGTFRKRLGCPGRICGSPQFIRCRYGGRRRRVAQVSIPGIRNYRTLPFAPKRLPSCQSEAVLSIPRLYTAICSRISLSHHIGGRSLVRLPDPSTNGTVVGSIAADCQCGWDAAPASGAEPTAEDPCSWVPFSRAGTEVQIYTLVLLAFPTFRRSCWWLH